jgi:hypothetical protein
VANKSQATRDGRFRRRCAMARQASSAVAVDAGWSRVPELDVRRLDAHFMKTSLIAVLGFMLIGCESSRQSALLTAEQAKTTAIRLGNDKASVICHRQPFHDGQPVTFVSGHWIWRELAPGDIEATVELAADGSTNSVAINILSESVLF